MKPDGKLEQRTEQPEVAENADQPDALKREFMARFGRYAATAPAAMFVLMSPRTSKAIASDGAP